MRVGYNTFINKPQMDKKITMYYDILDRFTNGPGVVWEWHNQKCAPNVHFGITAIMSGHKYVLMASSIMVDDVMVQADKPFAKALSCSSSVINPAFYSVFHGDLLLIHIMIKHAKLSILLCKTAPSDHTQIYKGDMNSTCVDVRDHATLTYSTGIKQEGLYATKDIKHKLHGVHLCRYFGKLALYASNDKQANQYCCKLGFTDTPLTFVCAFDCKARRINNFPDKPYNVEFYPYLTEALGYHIIVRTIKDIAKVCLF